MKTNCNNPEITTAFDRAKAKINSMFGNDWVQIIFAFLIAAAIVAAGAFLMYRHDLKAEEARKQREMTEGIPYQAYYTNATIIGKDSHGNKILANHYDRYVIIDDRAYLIPSTDPIKETDPISVYDGEFSYDISGDMTAPNTVGADAIELDPEFINDIAVPEPD